MESPLSRQIEALAQKASLSDGTPCRILDAEAIARIAKETCVTGRTVEIAALKRQIFPDRYLRNRKTLTGSDQIRLLESTVCIVGLGGLGGLVTETLARMGIGRFHLVDGDRFEVHNLNRQLLSGVDRIGTPKVKEAVRRVHSINPGLEVAGTKSFLTTENAEALVGGCSIVVDCLDSIRARFTLESAARHAGIPMVSAAVAGITGHVTTIYPEDKGLENIYGPENRLTQSRGAEAQLGCLAPGVNLIASLECAEVLKVLLGRDNNLRNSLLVVDLSDYTFETLQFC